MPCHRVSTHYTILLCLLFSNNSGTTMAVEGDDAPKPAGRFMKTLVKALALHASTSNGMLNAMNPMNTPVVEWHGGNRIQIQDTNGIPFPQMPFITGREGTQFMGHPWDARL